MYSLQLYVLWFIAAAAAADTRLRADKMGNDEQHCDGGADAHRGARSACNTRSHKTLRTGLIGPDLEGELSSRRRYWSGLEAFYLRFVAPPLAVSKHLFFLNVFCSLLFVLGEL